MLTFASPSLWKGSNHRERSFIWDTYIMVKNIELKLEQGLLYLIRYIMLNLVKMTRCLLELK